MRNPSGGDGASCADIREHLNAYAGRRTAEGGGGGGTAAPSRLRSLRRGIASNHASSPDHRRERAGPYGAGRSANGHWGGSGRGLGAHQQQSLDRGRGCDPHRWRHCVVPCRLPDWTLSSSSACAGAIYRFDLGPSPIYDRVRLGRSSPLHGVPSNPAWAGRGTRPDQEHGS